MTDKKDDSKGKTPGKTKNINDLHKELLELDPSYKPRVKAVDQKHAPEGIKLVSLLEGTSADQPWLWNNVIPLEAFTLFAGVGGLGKSQLLMFLAAHVSNGRPFTAGGIEHKLPQGSVIILSSEDSHNYAIKPRLEALNADLSKIHRLVAVTSTNSKRLIALDKDLFMLQNTLNRLKEQGEIVKLIIIDPVISFMGRTKDYINSEVSNFLYGLTELAEEHKLAIILNKHLRKKDGSSVAGAVDEISGSHAWVNCARQVWLICRDHEDEKKILFVDGKSNIKAIVSGMAFNIVPTEIVNSDNKVVKTSKISWLDEIVTIKADEAVSQERFEKSKGTKAKEFIMDYIEKYGQSVIKNIFEEAVKRNISSTTFRRIYTELVKDGTLKKERGIAGHTLRFSDL